MPELSITLYVVIAAVAVAMLVLAAVDIISGWIGPLPKSAVATPDGPNFHVQAVCGQDVYKDAAERHRMTKLKDMREGDKAYCRGILNERRCFTVNSVEGDKAYGDDGVMLASFEFQRDRYSCAPYSGWALSSLCDKKALDKVDFT